MMLSMANHQIQLLPPRTKSAGATTLTTRKPRLSRKLHPSLHRLPSSLLHPRLRPRARLSNLPRPASRMTRSRRPTATRVMMSLEPRLVRPVRHPVARRMRRRRTIVMTTGSEWKCSFSGRSWRLLLGCSTYSISYRRARDRMAVTH